MTTARVPYDTTGVATPFGLSLHHTQITMPPGKEDVARAFYVGVLGVVEIRKPQLLARRGGLCVRSERMEIHLGVEDPFRPAARAHPGIIVNALPAHVSAGGDTAVGTQQLPVDPPALR